MDNEAGLEHISRRTTNNIDALLIVVNDNPISIHTAHSIVELSSSLKSKIKRQYIVTNMVRDDRKSMVRERVEALDVPYMGDVPYDEELGDALFKTGSLAGLGNSLAKDSVSKFLDTIRRSNGDT